jgi:methyl-accepting chemotaxis protein
VAGTPAQETLLAQLEPLIATKLAELDETIALRRTQGFEAARAVVVTDRGKNYMDSVRAGFGKMEEEIGP